MYLKTLSDSIEPFLWPIATIIVVCLLRNQIADLISRINKLNYKDLEIDLSEYVNKVKEEFEPTSKNSNFVYDKQAYYSTKKQETIFDLAELSPESAIAMSWKKLDSKLFQINKKHPNITESDQILPAMEIARRLLRKGRISFDLYQIMFDLSMIRTAAVHQINKNTYTKEITAIEYDKLVDDVVNELDFMNFK